MGDTFKDVTSGEEAVSIIMDETGMTKEEAGAFLLESFMKAAAEDLMEKFDITEDEARAALQDSLKRKAAAHTVENPDIEIPDYVYQAIGTGTVKH